MRQRVLQEGQIYVKQNLKDEQIEVSEIQKMIDKENKKLADCIMRYKEELCKTRQF